MTGKDDPPGEIKDAPCAYCGKPVDLDAEHLTARGRPVCSPECHDMIEDDAAGAAEIAGMLGGAGAARRAVGKRLFDAAKEEATS
jgi:endogenous inhibitor of DNA gyrase (YacG/DUF329 family)